MLLPGIGIDLEVAGLVGMAAMFAGASRAFLASTVFAFEATQQPFSLLPLLGGCAASYLVLLVGEKLVDDRKNCPSRRGRAARLHARRAATSAGPRCGLETRGRLIGQPNPGTSSPVDRRRRARFAASRISCG